MDTLYRTMSAQPAATAPVGTPPPLDNLDAFLAGLRREALLVIDGPAEEARKVPSPFSFNTAEAEEPRSISGSFASSWGDGRESGPGDNYCNSQPQQPRSRYNPRAAAVKSALHRRSSGPLTMQQQQQEEATLGRRLSHVAWKEFEDSDWGMDHLSEPLSHLCGSPSSASIASTAGPAAAYGAASAWLTEFAPPSPAAAGRNSLRDGRGGGGSSEAESTTSSRRDSSDGERNKQERRAPYCGGVDLRGRGSGAGRRLSFTGDVCKVDGEGRGGMSREPPPPRTGSAESRRQSVSLDGCGPQRPVVYSAKPGVRHVQMNKTKSKPPLSPTPPSVARLAEREAAAGAMETQQQQQLQPHPPTAHRPLSLEPSPLSIPSNHGAPADAKLPPRPPASPHVISLFAARSMRRLKACSSSLLAPSGEAEQEDGGSAGFHRRSQPLQPAAAAAAAAPPQLRRASLDSMSKVMSMVGVIGGCASSSLSARPLCPSQSRSSSRPQTLAAASAAAACTSKSAVVIAAAAKQLPGLPGIGTRPVKASKPGLFSSLLFKQ